MAVSDVLTVAQVAEYLGLSIRTVETYRADGRMPEPTMVGRTPTWTREQIDQWQANRPGRGARTDLRGRDLTSGNDVCSVGGAWGPPTRP